MRNYRQRNCPRCTKPMLWHSPGEVINGCLSDEDWREVKAFAYANGRNWRAKLAAVWDDSANNVGWVRRIRNILGHSGLSKVKVPPQPRETRTFN